MPVKKEEKIIAADAILQGPPSRSFLRWAGSKRQHVSLLASFWHPTYYRYIEPFLGSGVLYFHLNPRMALLGDINTDLITTFLEVKRDPSAVSRSLSHLKKGRDAYYRIRSQDQLSQPSAQRAARFIFLNRFCFNGIYRTNKCGKFNVPYGGDRSGALPSAKLLRECSHLLGTATLRASDFEVLLESARCGDFVYMDPPYSVRARRTFAEYQSSGFTTDDVNRLRAVLLRLDRKGIPFLLTYADSEEGRVLSRGFVTRIVITRRNVAGFAAKRRNAREVLISNTDPLQ